MLYLRDNRTFFPRCHTPRTPFNPCFKILVDVSPATGAHAVARAPLAPDDVRRPKSPRLSSTSPFLLVMDYFFVTLVYTAPHDISNMPCGTKNWQLVLWSYGPRSAVFFLSTIGDEYLYSTLTIQFCNILSLNTIKSHSDLTSKHFIRRYHFE
jgi:hypothetical protein